MSLIELQNRPHRRFNPLLREWVLISPQRTQRPWQGNVEAAQKYAKKVYDPQCYLCPGNTRANGSRNPQYGSTFVFENDFPALLPEAHEVDVNHSGLIVGKSEKGICHVGCFSPQHDLAIPLMTNETIRGVIDMWVEEYNELGSIEWVKHVQIFENRGPLMGASNPHPHCQIWANATIPDYPRKELQSSIDYKLQNDRCLLCDY